MPLRKPYHQRIVSMPRKNTPCFLKRRDGMHSALRFRFWAIAIPWGTWQDIKLKASVKPAIKHAYILKKKESETLGGDNPIGPDIAIQEL